MGPGKSLPHGLKRRASFGGREQAAWPGRRCHCELGSASNQRCERVPRRQGGTSPGTSYYLRFFLRNGVSRTLDLPHHQFLASQQSLKHACKSWRMDTEPGSCILGTKSSSALAVCVGNVSSACWQCGTAGGTEEQSLSLSVNTGSVETEQRVKYGIITNTRNGGDREVPKAYKGQAEGSGVILRHSGCYLLP